jgi:hypothetical protein
MSRRQCSEDNIVQILDECDLSDLEDVLSESDEFIPQGDASESEDNLEVNSEESYIACVTSDVDSGEEDEFMAKSGKVWRSSVPPVTRQRQCNIATGSPGPTRATDVATTVYEVFKMFLDDEILDTICNFTNAEASRVVQELNANAAPNRMRIWIDVDPMEIRTFFGLLIAGALRCRKKTISEMWTSDESIRRTVFTAVMARNRFANILQLIRFDDKSTRVQRKANDKLAATREVWDRFVENFKKLFVPFEDMTVG